MRYHTLITIVYILLLSNCTNESKKNTSNENETDKDFMIQKKEVAVFLQNSNLWYRDKIDTLIDWDNELDKENNFKDQYLKWNKEISKWMIESRIFSKNFIDKETNVLNKNTGNRFCSLFFWYTNEIILYRIIGVSDESDLQRLEGNIKKETENGFRYISTLGDGLFADINRLPDEPSSYWFEAGNEWSYSVVVIKENDRWVIDKIERYSN